MLPRLLLLGYLWFLNAVLTLAVLELLWERYRDREKARRAKSLRTPPELRLLEAKSPPQWWQKGDEPPEWESETNGDDESK